MATKVWTTLMELILTNTQQWLLFMIECENTGLWYLLGSNKVDRVMRNCTSAVSLLCPQKHADNLCCHIWRRSVVPFQSCCRCPKTHYQLLHPVDLLMMLMIKKCPMYQIMRFYGVKLLAWKSGGLKCWTNIMSGGSFCLLALLNIQKLICFSSIT